jgi:hypothetical protein
MKRHGFFTIHYSPYHAYQDEEYHLATYGEHVNTWDVIF